MQRTMTTRFASAIVLVLAPAAMGDVGEQLAKIVPEDGGEGHRFGRKLAMSGTTALVSAPRDSPLGLESGSVYVYDLSAPSSPVELVKIVPGDGDAGDRFGSGLRMEGHIAVIGAPLDGDNGEWSGSAYVFDLSDPANPTQLFKLLPEDGTAFEYFGSSIALDGTIGLFGSAEHDPAGAAYLFDLSTGQQLARFFADDGAPGDNFGSNVALSGTLALVGARWDDDNGTDSGSAYVFDVSDPTTPVQLAKIAPEDGAAGDWFGATALEGTTAIIGAFRANVGPNNGAAYLYDLTDPANPELMSKFVPDDPYPVQGFGGGARFAGDIVVFPGLGTDANGADLRVVYVFDISTPSDPEQVATLLPEDPDPEDRFGANPDIGNGLVIAGAWGDDDNGEESGSAYVLDVAGLFPCPADLDGDGAVGVEDLIIVIVLWGTDEPAADIDGDGEVGVDDLTTLILAWGPCVDCNDNGVADETDVADGASGDCNGNAVPDECELASNDCDGNGVPDECDPDCDANGTPDACELPDNDCNDNGVVDACDIAEGVSSDLDANGTPDECQMEDCNANGVPDLVEIANGSAADCNGTLVPDACELADNDCNENAVPDECELINDACGTATTVGLGSVAFNTCAATAEGPAESLCGGPIEHDVWFRHLTSCEGTLSIRVDATFDPVIVIYSASCPDEADEALVCGTGSVALEVTAGSIYRIRVGSADGSAGSGTLTLSCE